MTAVERKNKTNACLKSLGIHILDHLPIIEEESEAKLRTPQEIAQRVLVLVYLNYVAEVSERKISFSFSKGCA